MFSVSREYGTSIPSIIMACIMMHVGLRVRDGRDRNHGLMMSIAPFCCLGFMAILKSRHITLRQSAVFGYG